MLTRTAVDEVVAGSRCSIASDVRSVFHVGSLVTLLTTNLLDDLVLS
jgi:hypothetical protein